jgi:charged multivesicular body protein 3
MEEIVNDALDSTLDNEDIEEEIEEEVDKVLTAIAGETASELPDAVRKEKEKMKQPSTSVPAEVILIPMHPSAFCNLISVGLYFDF